MKKSTSAGSSRGGSGGTRSSSKPSSACSGTGDSKSKPSSATSTASSVKSKPSSADSLTGRASRPSDKLNPKTCDPFNDKKTTSAFVSVYSNGGLPCRLQHGSVKHKLAWNTNIETVGFDPVLITLAEGLKETVHPYAFVARQGFVELLKVPNAGAKATPILSRLITPIRTALAHPDNQVFEAGLEALITLSEAVNSSLNQHLKQFMVPLSKRLSETSHRDGVTRCLQTLETNGGREATAIIKSKIPTYNSVIVGPG